MEYTKKLVQINQDILIEIHYNPNLSNRPYQLRIFGYDNYSENRLTVEDMLKFSEVIADFVFDNPNSTGYNDNYTGLPRLWHHRRNECLEQINKNDTTPPH